MGVSRVIEAVGVDSNRTDSGPVALQAQRFQQELQEIAPETSLQGGNWHPGNTSISSSNIGSSSLCKGLNFVNYRRLSTETPILPFGDGDEQEPDS